MNPSSSKRAAVGEIDPMRRITASVMTCELPCLRLVAKFDSTCSRVSLDVARDSILEAWQSFTWDPIKRKTLWSHARPFVVKALERWHAGSQGGRRMNTTSLDSIAESYS